MADKQVSVRLKAEGGEKLKAEFRGIGDQAEVSLGQIERGARMSGTGLQNVGFQVQDFAVQVAGGTDATRALAQQLPQLLSGFGLLGVLLGTTAAVAIPIFNAFGIGADKAEELSTSVTVLTAAMREYESASRTAANPADLFGDFGAGAAQAREVLEIQRQIAAARAQNALDQASGSITGFLGRDAQRIDAYREIIRELQGDLVAVRANPPLAVDFDFAAAEADIAKLQGRLERMEAQVVENLTSSMNVSADAAARIVEALGAVGDASGPRAQADAMGALRDAVIDAANQGGTLSAALLGVLEALTDAELSALALAQVDMAGNIGIAADEAGRLAQNLMAAASLNYGRIQNSGQSGPDAARRSVMDLNAPGVLTGTVAGGAGGVFVPPRGRAGGGGGGGGVSQAEREAARIYDQTRTAAEKYKIELAELNALHKAGHLDTETYTRAVEKLGKDLVKTSDLGKKAADAIRGAFDNLFDDPAAALRNLAAELAKMALYAGLAKAFPGVFGSGGLVPLANANGNAFDGGVVQPFATGGIVSSATMFPMRGGMGVMGEAGPEAIMPLARVGGKLGVVAAGGGGPSVKFEVHNHNGSPISASEQRGRDGERIIRMMVGKDLGSGAHDRVLASRFGSRPSTLKR